MISEWAPGESITLRKNPYYHRTGEGLPYFDLLIFRFIGQVAEDNIEALLSGECHLLDQSTYLKNQSDRLRSLETEGLVSLVFGDATSWEHLDFGIQPLAYDDGYSQYLGDRADFFGDVRTRRAVALCIDRGGLAESVAFHRESGMDTYLPSDHPLSTAEIQKTPYDPDAGAALLDEVGWMAGEDGFRSARGVEGVIDGTMLTFEYLTTNSEEHRRVAEFIQNDLGDCGIEVNVIQHPAEELYANGPDGSLFGRRFDLAQFSWLLQPEPPCHLFLGTAVPGEELTRFPYSWGGWNLTGWRHDEYDAACQNAQNSLPGQPSYVENHTMSLEIFASELPVIPLFVHQKLAASRPDMCGFSMDPTAGELWNIEAFGYGEFCAIP
jgi:peptide/nickel transport system substrate-binding protein